MYTYVYVCIYVHFVTLGYVALLQTKAKFFQIRPISFGYTEILKNSVLKSSVGKSGHKCTALALTHS